MGWEALGLWGENVVRVEPLAGGVANDVWSVRIRGTRAVGRLSGRARRLRPALSLSQHLGRLLQARCSLGEDCRSGFCLPGGLAFLDTPPEVREQPPQGSVVHLEHC